MTIGFLHSYHVLDLIKLHPCYADLSQITGLEHWYSLPYFSVDLHHDRYIRRDVTL
jgi:hypothetical protein